MEQNQKIKGREGLGIREAEHLGMILISVRKSNKALYIQRGKALTMPLLDVFRSTATLREHPQYVGSVSVK